MTRDPYENLERFWNKKIWTVFPKKYTSSFLVFYSQEFLIICKRKTREIHISIEHVAENVFSRISHVYLVYTYCAFPKKCTTYELVPFSSLVWREVTFLCTPLLFSTLEIQLDRIVMNYILNINCYKIYEIVQA